MTTETNSILTKIKKLQNLTVERGASPEEAANAQALLFAHNLSQADVEYEPTRVLTSAAELRDALNRHDDALCAIAGAAVILIIWLAAIL